jgi:hypothetical protein
MTHFSHTGAFEIDVCGLDFQFRKVPLHDRTPSGAQIAAAAGFTPSADATVLQILTTGELEDVRPGETVDLTIQVGKFVIVESDRTFHFTVDGTRYPWPGRVVSGALLRRLASIPAEKALCFERRDQPDQVLEEADLVDLAEPGVEHFYSRVQAWRLNVQGKVIDSLTPTIVVKDAMVQAGFDITQAWQIFLKIAGQPKVPQQMSSVIDLRTPGIEKLRLSPVAIGNGEAVVEPTREFALLDVDDEFLDGLGLLWETIIVIEGGARRRWLVIHDYAVVQGYTLPKVMLALEVPNTYPAAQIDMFYAYPPLALAVGGEIPSTQVRATIRNLEFHGWSRHRGEESKWNPTHDNVISHLALVEAALLKEVGQ